MKKHHWIFLSLLLAGALLLALPGVANAGREPQAVYQTPTALPDGRILYTVKAGETCLSISLLTGTTIDQLRGLNDLNANCELRAGAQIILGVAAPATATPTPSGDVTPTPLLPSPTPFRGTGVICIVLFGDADGNGSREGEEAIIPDGKVSVSDRSGTISLTGTTGLPLSPEDLEEDREGLCFKDVAENDYNVSVAVPDGYNPTTVMNFPLKIQAGDQVTLDFGAQPSSTAQEPTPIEGGQSPMLGIVGGLLLVAGAGLGIYMLRMRRQ